VDVILDSNIYLADIRFAKTGFEGLFAYLRRTNRNLVIPEVVFHEVLARHKDRLSEFIKQAKSNWSNVQLWKLSDRVDLPNVDIEAASKLLLERLRQPTKSLKSVIYGKNSKISLMDVALRGINRIKPADANGEQLRDVLLWMQVLEYAKESRDGVAFISQNKKEFCEKDSNALHSDLVKECTDLGANVHFYFDIVDFLQKHSLKQYPFLKSQLPPELSPKSLETQLAFVIVNERTAYGYPDTFRVLEMLFKDGTLFEISDSVSIAELNYEGQVMCRFNQRGFYRSVFLQPLSEASLAVMQKKHVLPKGLISSWTEVDKMPVIYTVPPEDIEQPTMVEKVFNIQAVVSARFRDGKLASSEVESFKLFET
jgi:hypothetical protein